MRETKKIITPDEKIEVEIYTYLTGRDRRALNGVFLKALSAKGDPKDLKADVNYSGELMREQEDVLIKSLVKSVANADGRTVLDCVLDMREEDYNFVVAELNNIAGEKKIQSSTTAG